MNPTRRRAIFRRFQQANPAPTTELEHSTSFELLAAVMLSAHTTNKSVNAATRKLFPVANTPVKIYAPGVEQELNATTPEEYRKDAHHWLLLHGRYVCVTRKPLCPKCLIADLCEYPGKTPESAVAKPVRRVGSLADAAAQAARKAGTLGTKSGSTAPDVSRCVAQVSGFTAIRAIGISDCRGDLRAPGVRFVAGRQRRRAAQ